MAWWVGIIIFLCAIVIAGNLGWFLSELVKNYVKRFYKPPF